MREEKGKQGKYRGWIWAGESIVSSSKVLEYKLLGAPGTEKVTTLGLSLAVL